MFGRLIRVSIVIYAARILGPESWGAFSYAMSFLAFAIIFSDIGMGAAVTRETVKNIGLGNQYFSTAFFIKLAILVPSAAIIIFGAPYLTKIEEAKVLMPIIALTLIFDSLRNFGFAISRAKEKMEWEGMNEIFTNLAITILGFSFLLMSPTSRALAIGYAAAAGIGLFLIAWKLRSYFKNLFSSFNFSLAKSLLSAAWPFALASSLGAIMINTDTIILGWLRPAAEVGWYSAAQRPVLFLYVLPSLFAISLFPVITRIVSQNNQQQLKKVLKTSLKIAIISAASIALIGILFGNQIINLFFGADYQNSVPAFKILMLTVIIVFPSAIVTNAIFAYNQQKSLVAFSALGAISNVILDLLFIPPLGIIGCALATLLTQIIANGFMWRKLYTLVSHSK